MKDIVEILYDYYHALKACYLTWTYKFYANKYNIPLSAFDQGVDISIFGNGKIIIGEGTYIGHYTIFSVIEDTTLSIGKNCAISHRVYITTINRKPVKYDINKDTSHNQQHRKGDITIGDNCLLGVGSVVLPNVTIGDNCFIGANAVVTHNIPSYSIAIGIPAKVIKTIEH